MKKALFFILALFLFVSCIKKIERPSRIDPSLYFPLNVGDEGADLFDHQIKIIG